jgi:hypothetical protein
MVREFDHSLVLVGWLTVHVRREAPEMDDQDLRQYPWLHLLRRVTVRLAPGAVPGEEKSVIYGEEKSVMYGEEKSVMYGEEKSVMYGEEKSVMYGKLCALAMRSYH